MTCRSLLASLLGVALALPLFAQQAAPNVPLDDLSAFQSPSDNWQIVGAATAHPDKNESLTTSPGKGILANVPADNGAKDIFSVVEHGDADIEFDFMMARHSNSGVYLQGRYEVQLLDSHGKATVTYGDCGGIYHRWDESRGKGNEGYQGHAPRINACKAPGLWQHMSISFQAPKFGPNGQKISHAKIIQLTLNGEVLHEHVELTGPTRGSAFAEEGPLGPLRIQGDHGPVAFRNLSIRGFDAPPVALSALTYQVFTGVFDEVPDFSQLRPVASGNMEQLSAEVVAESEKFILRVAGTMNFPRNGNYQFDLNTLGNGQLNLDGKSVIAYGSWAQQGNFQAEGGAVPFELVYHKRESWYNNGLALVVSGPGLRAQSLHRLSSMPLTNPVSPIYIEAKGKPNIMRCFIDYADEQSQRRIVHAVSVGSPSGVHYTYDPDRAALVQGWRGEFLNATPMWNDRGDGSSRPRGAITTFGDAAGIALSTGESTPWPAEVPEALSYHFEGYGVAPGKEGFPAFRYRLGDATITDTWIAEGEAQGLKRVMVVDGNAPVGAILRMAQGKEIRELSQSSGTKTYVVDQRYYVRIPSSQDVILLTRAGVTFLVTDLSKQSSPLIYSLEW